MPWSRFCFRPLAPSSHPGQAPCVSPGHCRFLCRRTHCRARRVPHGKGWEPAQQTMPRTKPATTPRGADGCVKQGWKSWTGDGLRHSPVFRLGYKADSYETSLGCYCHHLRNRLVIGMAISANMHLRLRLLSGLGSKARGQIRHRE